jgi:hypothetical protein
MGQFLWIFFLHENGRWNLMIDVHTEQPESGAAEAHFFWQYFTVTNHTEAKKGGSKNACCMFCDKIFSGYSTARAAAHILAGRPTGISKLPSA